jgi:hypothetical protein
MPTIGKTRPISFSTWNADSQSRNEESRRGRRSHSVSARLCGSGRLAAIPYPSYSAISMLYIPRTFNGRQFS